MSNSFLIKDFHLKRNAIIYIRQSSPQQVITNKESLRLQYNLKQRAIDLGWKEFQIEIIDSDLGLTASSAHLRKGFQELLAKTALGEVGLILSYEVTRLSRNCSDFYPLLDMCAYKNCLIADCDSVYDPSTPDGRLLLGLKGQISELELHTIKTRMQAGLLNKAKRGELKLPLPIGFVRNEEGKVEKTPNQEIRECLNLIFQHFLKIKSCYGLLRFLYKKEICIPRKTIYNEEVWKKATNSSLRQILTNPAYAGTYVYGRKRVVSKETGKRKQVPEEEWKVCLKEKYPAYISWEDYKRIQKMLHENYSDYEKNLKGKVKDGSALLQGIVYCGKCASKMRVNYNENNGYYTCNRRQVDYGENQCHSIPSPQIDATVENAFFEAISPIELDLFEESLKKKKVFQEEINKSYELQLKRLHYQVGLAQRRYEQCDPENRLVASELEAKWEEALRLLKEAEKRREEESQEEEKSIAPDLKAMLKNIGKELPKVWKKNGISRQQKKELLRVLVEKVVLEKINKEELNIRIVWIGGASSSFRILARKEAQNEMEMKKNIMKWTEEGKSDSEMAKLLTEKGYSSRGKEECLSKSSVSWLRKKHQIRKRERSLQGVKKEGYLTVSEVAYRVKKSKYWVYTQIKSGTLGVNKELIKGFFLIEDTPETFKNLKKLIEKSKI